MGTLKKKNHKGQYLVYKIIENHACSLCGHTRQSIKLVPRPDTKAKRDIRLCVRCLTGLNDYAHQSYRRG